jgi:mycothiol synthase
MWIDALPEGYMGSVGAPDDLSDMAALIARGEAEITGSARTTIDTLRTILGDSEIDTTADVVTVSAPDGTIVGAAIFNNRSPFVGSWTTATVDPDHLGHGIGGAILDWAEHKASAAIDRAPDGARVTMIVGANERNERARRLYLSRGFTVDRYFLEMEIALDRAIDVAPVPEGIRLRTLGADEPLDRLASAVDASFRDHFGYTESDPAINVARWNQWRTSELWDDSLVWLAEAGDSIVGVNVGLAWNAARTDQGYVATLGVLPPWRGRGLARCLLTTSFEEYRRRGMASVSLHVDADSLTGATRLYRGVGMVEVQTEMDFIRELRAGEDLTTR